MSRRRARALLAAKVASAALAAGLASAASASCGGEASPIALDEPIRVHNASFKSGDLPGLPPPSDPAAGVAPFVTNVDTPNGVATQGQAGRVLQGRTSTDAASVAFRFADLGTGFWVFPVDAPDLQANGELTWNVHADIARNVPPGSHPLQLVAFDHAGRAGTQRIVPLCVASAVPDGLNACDPSLPPPAAVVSLAWDTNVDLDLVVVTPDGKTVDPKHPTTAGYADGGVDKGAAASPRTGVLDRDSNGACLLDGIRRENLVFKEAPADGTYTVYASLFDACGNAPVRYTVSLHQARPRADGTNLEQVVVSMKSGILIGVDANGGRTRGSFVTQFTFP